MEVDVAPNAFWLLLDLLLEVELHALGFASGASGLALWQD